MREKINIIEVGPRDGLQNVKEHLSVDQKIKLIQKLVSIGFHHIEAGAFVNPAKVPAMQGTDEIAHQLTPLHQKLWYLVPNLHGLKNALAQKITQIAFFTAASETFNQKNIGMGVYKSLDVIAECVEYLRDEGYTIITDFSKTPTHHREIKLRLYISTVIACPYDGPMQAKHTLDIIEKTEGLGFSQYSLGDTIGVGTPKDWKNLLDLFDERHFAKNIFAMHCHDTYATALSNVAYGLTRGIRSFDSSIGGLGGCPYAPGAGGNLATEDLVYFLENEGFDTGINLANLKDVFDISRTGNLCNNSKVFKTFKS
ncbi:hydroxymethylglutaryl-CoA lyase [bacterium]|nr:hydroxymethylglutaryl-CoA lyase [bacterium]